MDSPDSIRTVFAVQRQAADFRETDRQASSDLEETARRFEEIFVRQFVQEMTKSMFESGLAGDDTPAWMGHQSDMQADVLTDVLARHIAGNGTLRIADMLLKQWQAAENPTGPSTETHGEKQYLTGHTGDIHRREPKDIQE